MLLCMFLSVHCWSPIVNTAHLCKWAQCHAWSIRMHAEEPHTVEPHAVHSQGNEEKQENTTEVKNLTYLKLCHKIISCHEPEILVSWQHLLKKICNVIRHVRHGGLQYIKQHKLLQRSLLLFQNYCKEVLCACAEEKQLVKYFALQ